MLSQFLQRFIKSKSTATEADLVANLPKHAQIKHHAAALLAIQGKKFNPLKASDISLTTTDSDIVKVTTRLAGFLDIVRSKGNIQPSVFYSEYETTTLDNFFKDEGGYYIPLQTLTVFLNVCVELADELETLKQSNVGEFAYVNRLLTKSLASIINICKAIEEAKY